MTNGREYFGPAIPRISQIVAADDVRIMLDLIGDTLDDCELATNVIIGMKCAIVASLKIMVKEADLRPEDADELLAAMLDGFLAATVDE